MELIKWLTDKDNNNTPSFVIVIVVICVVVFETTVLLKMFLPAWFQKKDDSKLFKKKPEVKNAHLVKILKRLDEIEKRLDAQYGFIREIATEMGIALLVGQKVPFPDLVESSLTSIMLGGNGNVRDKLVNAIIKEPNGRVNYQSQLGAFIRKHEKNIKTNSHFKETITWIEKRIDGGY